MGDELVTHEPLESADVPGGLPKNFPRSCLLLLIAERPSHGYDLLERLRRLGVPATDPGGLYRSLRSMEREGLATSRWEMSAAGPARRTYVLTDRGWRWLHVWATAIAESRLILSSYLERYETLTSDDSDGETALAAPSRSSQLARPRRLRASG